MHILRRCCQFDQTELSTEMAMPELCSDDGKIPPAPFTKGGEVIP